mmetsp:Transcript_30406/g.77365  ORF Transcript_30406/g.77365 Transcript_30406/m.77365 type:complete len:304 (+) Transcript_30406:13-924(+)
MRPSRRSLILSISHRSCPVKHRRMQRRRAALGPKTLLPRPTTVSPLGRHAKVLGRPRFCSRGEEQLADLGLGLLKHQVQPRIDGVVNGDGALLASEHHATKARLVVLLVRRRGQLVLLVQAKLEGLLDLALLLNDLRVLLGGKLQARLHERIVARPATDLDIVLKQHQRTLHDQLDNEGLGAGLALQLLSQSDLGVIGEVLDHLLPSLDLLQARLVDRCGACDGTLRLHLLRLARVVLHDLLLRLVHDLELLDAELLERLRGDLLGLVLGLIEDELGHLEDLLLALLACIHGSCSRRPRSARG